MIILSQRDKRWADKKIGQSNITIGGFGCLITSLSMLSEWYGLFRNPEWMAKHLSFTKDGLILWKSIDSSELPFRFVYRYYGRDDKKILEILNSRDNACVLQVNDGKHWVVLVGYHKLFGFKIIDPFYGDTVYLKRRYKNITGFAEIARK